MSDNTIQTDTETIDQTVAAEAVDTTDDDTHDTTVEQPTVTVEELQTELKKTRTEAATRRKQLREAEEQRDAAMEKYKNLAVTNIESAMKDFKGMRVAALFDSGAEWQTLMHDDGTVDMEAVTAAAKVAAERYGFTLPKPSATRGLPRVPEAGAAHDYVDPSWAAALKKE